MSVSKEYARSTRWRRRRQPVASGMNEARMMSWIDPHKTVRQFKWYSGKRDWRRKQQEKEEIMKIRLNEEGAARRTVKGIKLINDMRFWGFRCRGWRYKLYYEQVCFHLKTESFCRKSFSFSWCLFNEWDGRFCFLMSSSPIHSMINYQVNSSIQENKRLWRDIPTDKRSFEGNLNGTPGFISGGSWDRMIMVNICPKDISDLPSKLSSKKMINKMRKYF